MQEEGHRVTREATPLGRRIADAVRGRPQHIVGEALQHVADIDDQLALHAASPPASAIAVEQFQPASSAPSRRVMVLISSCAPARMPGASGADGRIMEQAQHRNCRRAPCRRTRRGAELEITGDGGQQPAPGRVEGIEQCELRVVEIGHLARPQVQGMNCANGWPAAARGRHARIP